MKAQQSSPRAACLTPTVIPGVNKAECEEELKRLLGLEKIIWLPGIAGKDITDGHTDFYARFTHPGTVVAGLEQDPSSLITRSPDVIWTYYGPPRMPKADGWR